MEVKAISCWQYIKGIDLSRNVSEKWEEIVGLEHHAAGMNAYEHAMQVHCSEGSARQGNPAEEKTCICIGKRPAIKAVLPACRFFVKMYLGSIL